MSKQDHLPAAGQIEQELQARIDHAYKTVWHSGDAAAFVEAFFAPDGVVTASNAATIWQGARQITEVINSVIADIKDLHPTVVWTRPVGTNAAAQFVTYRIEARDPARQAELGDHAKALYAWERTPRGWRVVADLSAYTGMDTPSR